MLNEVEKKLKNYLQQSDADQAAFAVIDFNKHSKEAVFVGDEKYFDLASLTKPLLNSFNYLKYKLDDKNLELLLNHRAGLPAWGLLPRVGWQNQLLSYDVRESETLYSDYSALRFSLELAKKGIDSFSIIEEFIDVFFWIQKSGYIVHDPNAFNLGKETTHAGLFGSINGLAETLIEMNKKYDFIQKVRDKMQNHDQRFVLGFDTAQDLTTTLAGQGCSKNTFGHLGFTGTSFWIDADKNIGHILLTNTTKKYWFNRSLLNPLRKELGSLSWKYID